MRTLKQLPLASVLLALAPLGLAAPPDAGSLLREELQRTPSVAPAMPPKVDNTTPAAADNDTGPKVTVTSFKLVGLTAVAEADAQAFLAPWVGQALSLTALNGVADKFEKWLRGRGLFLARAYLPPQNIKSGLVEIRVLEGRVEGVDIKLGPGARISEDMLRATVSGVLPDGAALDQTNLERGLLLANDLPGISARAILAPGKGLGTSRVMVEAAEGPILSGNVEADNTGNRYTGNFRLGGGVVINDPYGHGDQWSLKATKSQGSTFWRGAWTTPLNPNGLKAGVAYIESRYALCCDATINSLLLDGSATAYSGFISYPVLRSRLKNLTVSATVARRDFLNRAAGATTSEKTTDSLTLGINGDWNEQTGLGAYSTYNAQWVAGNLDLARLPADAVQDGNSAKTQGDYQKLSGQFTYLRRLNANSAVYAAISGQWANKNLDSSEKFSLGGPTGVRAYPTGEGSGDEGVLLTAEWRRELSSTLRLSLFADYGEVSLHSKPWQNWNANTPGSPNRVALAGVGASLAFNPVPGSQITATVASRVGKNPSHDTSGRDSDGTKDYVRFWLQGSMAF